MLQSRNRALAVYGLQVLLAIIAAPGDIAKLAGLDPTETWPDPSRSRGFAPVH
jgi:hypothetical protein